MRPRVHTLVPAIALSLLTSPVAAGHAQQPTPGRRPITWDDVASLRAVADPQLSPDGAHLLYTVRVTDVEANRRVPSTWMVTLAGGATRRWPNDSLQVTEARWSPDGNQVAYIAQGQLWIADADGSAPRQLTTLNGGASGPVWSPAGDHIAFTTTVYPECSDNACNAARDRAQADSKVKARVTESLMYRHWSAWGDGTRSHLFIVATDGSAMKDLTAGARYDVPLPPFGGSEGYAFSPDGHEVAYTAKDAGREEAWSTDVNVYTVPAAGGAPTVITASNKGADQNPVYSPDGRFIAFASQARAGFESDRWRLMLHDRASRSTRELVPAWDRNAESYFFAPDSRTLFVGTGDRGRDKLFRIALTASGSAAMPPTAEITANNNTSFTASRDGRTLAWLRDAVDHPAEVWVRPDIPTREPVGRERQLTHENDAALTAFSLNPAEDFWFAGAQGDSVHGFIVKPPNFDPARRYPVVFLIHGGPQGAWLDNWGGRWSFQLFASIGAAVVAINPRGSTGYGQAFTDGVTKDWGGKVYEDLMLGLDAALARNPWMDGTRVAAAGGSFGGYMVNWMAGHTDRFKALVSHAGIFNLENMYGATEEIWFTEWEFGAPFWQQKAMDEQYRRWSPHLSAGNMRTPMLVLHGEQDFRVPYYEGVSLFSALQRQGVPSRFVIYPDEGHWILKPQNSRLWYQEVLGWIRKYVGDKVTS
ncbi:MAG: S9 family peptidase [Gemmatimonadaceae bacterium]|nr:S9 family peptidase [Gemmatimonadaceae bacterium]